MKKAKVTIILPNFNSENFIEKTIQSIINQSFTDWLLFLIDDNSNSKTKEILKKYKKNKKIKIFFLNKNIGPGPCRNFGIIKSNSDYLAFIDSDDLWGKNKISEGLRNTLYKEDSNTFCYFVLAGILMNDYTHFLKWCYENNSSFIKYKQVSNNIKFVNLILELYKNKNLSKNNENVNLQIKKDKHHKFLSHTSRMSAIEIKMIE